MSRRSWVIRFGAVAVVVAGLLGPGREPGARAARPVVPPPVAACDGQVHSQAVPGAWWSRQPILDASGSLAGWDLEVGFGDETPRAARLPVEAAVSGPRGGLVVVTESDDRRSLVRLVAARGGCAETVVETAAIARRAVLDPGRDELYVHLLRRSDRADLGVWRLPSLSAGADQLEPFAGPAGSEPLIAALGPIWATELAFDATGSRLAIQSCALAGCVTRIVDLDTRAVTVVAGPDQGDVVALAGDRLVTWAACDGLPCPLVAFDLGSGRRTVLEPAAVAAAPVSGPPTRLAVTTGDGPTLRTRLIDAAGRTVGPSSADLDRRLPAAVGSGAGSGLEAPAGWLAVDTSGPVLEAVPIAGSPSNPEVDR